MMQFDWTTFILEILNFLVLVWILKSWFYKPVLSILDARRQKINEEMNQAIQLRSEAEALRQHYETLLQNWEKEQLSSRRQLENELALSFSSGLESIKKHLADEETKLRKRHQALAAAQEAALEWESVEAAYKNTAAMLQRLASPQLTQSIVAIFLEDISRLSESEQASLRKAAKLLSEAGAEVEISSAHQLDETSLSELTQSLSAAAGQKLQFNFRLDADLIAGIRAQVGECRLHVNLADELLFFRNQELHEEQ